MPAAPTKSPTSPKQDFLRTALFMMVIFMGVQLWMGSRNQAPTESSDKLYTRVLVDNIKLHDVSIVQDVQAYNRGLEDEVNKKKISKAEADDKETEAAILQADTQFKDGLYRNDTGKVRQAYQTLLGLRKKLLGTPAWSKSYDVEPPQLAGPATFPNAGGVIPGGVSTFNWTSWSGQGLYDRVVSELTTRNKTDYVYGFVPGYQLIDFLVHLTGANPGFSYAFAAFLLALLVRATVFPLTQKQLMFGRQMSQLVPLTNEIKAKYKNDQTTQQQKIMELYREYGINPLAGCFPMLIQMPLFLGIYQCMLRYQFEFQKGTFLWINPVTSRATHGFTGTDLGQQDPILIVIYGITMISATLLTPVTDPTQAKQQRGMGLVVGLMFTVFMFTGAFPVVGGFVLYWTFTNLLATAQSLRSYRLPMPALVKVNAQGGGVLPKPASKWQQMMDRMMDEQKKIQNTDGKGSSSGDQSSKNGSSSLLPPSSSSSSSEPTKTGTPAKHKPKKRK